MTTPWERFTGWLMAAMDWNQRRLDRIKRSKPTYDAYPTVEYRPRVRLVMISGKFWEPIDTEGYDLNEINWRLAWRRDWLMDKILEAFIAINAKIDAEKEAKNDGQTS
jgi:hypothetical protein